MGIEEGRVGFGLKGGRVAWLGDDACMGYGSGRLDVRPAGVQWERKRWRADGVGLVLEVRNIGAKGTML